jgi:hypothetical protein
VRFLIKKGANIAAKKENGRTPLDEAKSSTADNPDLADVIQFLTEHQVERRFNILIYFPQTRIYVRTV